MSSQKPDCHPRSDASLHWQSSRQSRLLPAALALVVLLACPATSFAATAPAAADCAALGPARQVSLLGTPLRESPDLGSPAANRTEAQLARGACRSVANGSIDALVAAGPDDPVATTLDAHRDLLDGHREIAERKLRAALARRPDFAPAQVLLAQALLDREQRSEARRLLDAADASTPGDLRTAFLRLRLDTMDAPKGDGVGKLTRVLRDGAMTPELREIAGDTLLVARALEFAEKEAALRQALTFESQTPIWGKRLKLGRFLAEDSGKATAAREVLQQVLASEAPATAKDDARVLLAETWLFDAAAIDAQPTQRNAAEVAHAREVMGGNMQPLAKRIGEWHNLLPLRPFVAGIADPDARDSQGLTALCRATHAMDATAVRAALDAGAAVDGLCAGASSLAYVVRAGPGDFARKRDVVEVLLAHGADPDPKLYPGASYTARSFCADNFPECQRELLPLLDRAKAAHPAAVPVSPR